MTASPAERALGTGHEVASCTCTTPALRNWGRGWTSWRGEVVVQFWLKPGEAAAMLERGEEKEVERIPEQLMRLL